MAPQTHNPSSHSGLTTMRNIKTKEGAVQTVNDDGEIIETRQVPLADVMIETEYTPFFKTNYNHDTLKAARDAADYNTEPSMAQQNTRDEVDINHILAKFGVANVRNI